MDCCQCEGIEKQFDEHEARNKLKNYRKNGPANTTRLLIEALQSAGVEGATVLDIGGGVGAITLALLKSGAASATHVDASRAYVAAAREEASRQGARDKVTYHHANFVTIAPDIPAADIVTLDRVICCYHDMPALVGKSLEKAKNLYALVYPRDRWWLRAGLAIGNLFLRLTRDSFRGFLHRESDVEALANQHGFTRRFTKHTPIWQVVVYEKSNGQLIMDNGL